MNFLEFYDLVIGIILLGVGILLARKSKFLSDIPETKGHYSSKIMAQKQSVSLIMFGLIIILYSIFKK